jgi:hypothetical protein
MPETNFIDAYNRETGEKVTIPARWLELKHQQFQKFRKTPLQRKADDAKDPAPEPVTKKNTNEKGV